MCYTDLLVKPRSFDEAVYMMKLLKKMGYCTVGVDVGIGSEKIRSLREKGETMGMRVLEVVTLNAKDEREAKKAVSELGRGRIVIGKPRSPSVLRFFSRDSRVHVVEPVPRLTKLFDRNQSALMKQGRSMLGLNLSILLRDPSLLPWFDRMISFALRYGVDLVLYSGASSWNMLWHPRIVRHLLSSMGYSGRVGLAALSPEINALLR